MSSRASERLIVCDTDVVSYFFNQSPRADFFRLNLIGKSLAVSFVTIAQMYHGAYHARWGTNRIAMLEQYLHVYAILPYDYQVCLKWAEVKHLGEQDGNSIEDADCWVVACALTYNCTLATNNARHFRHIAGLDLISPDLT
jgi:tRNA(fMet)-specific endonuclease VapC